METKQFMYIVRLARFQENLSQRDLAKKAEVSPTSVQKIECGGSVRAQTLGKVLDALNISDKDREDAYQRMKEAALQIF